MKKVPTNDSALEKLKDKDEKGEEDVERHAGNYLSPAELYLCPDSCLDFFEKSLGFLSWELTNCVEFLFGFFSMLSNYKMSPAF